MVALLLPASGAGATSTASAVAVTPSTASATSVLNIPYCEGIEWEREPGADQVRVFALGSTIARYLGHPEVGLIWVSVHEADGTLIYSSTFNASSTTGADFRVPGEPGDRISISLTDDDNIVTACRGGDTIS